MPMARRILQQTFSANCMPTAKVLQNGAREGPTEVSSHTEGLFLMSTHLNCEAEHCP